MTASQVCSVAMIMQAGTLTVNEIEKNKTDSKNWCCCTNFKVRNFASGTCQLSCVDGIEVQINLFGPLIKIVLVMCLIPAYNCKKMVAYH